MPKKEKETNNPETDDLPADPDSDGPMTDKGAARFSVVLPAGVARAVRKSAAEENMLISEYVRAVLRGDVKPPELED